MLINSLFAPGILKYLWKKLMMYSRINWEVIINQESRGILEINEREEI